MQGDWRLSVETSLDVRVLSFVRTGDGFLTAMHDVLPRDGEARLAALTFNPGQNRSQVSSLRLRLFITAGESVVGMSLLESPTGHLTNISTIEGR